MIIQIVSNILLHVLPPHQNLRKTPVDDQQQRRQKDQNEHI